MFVVIVSAALITRMIQSHYGVDLEVVFYVLFISLSAIGLHRTLKEAGNGVGIVVGTPLFNRKESPVVFWLTTALWVVVLSSFIVYLVVSLFLRFLQ